MTQLLHKSKPRPPHPRDLGATRFFARVTGFTAECPHCGVVATTGPGSARTVALPRAAYDRKTARWTCGGCHRTYVIGLLAWPNPKGTGSQGLPDDQAPGPRQLAQLRAEGDGYWLPDALRDTNRQDMSNLAGEPADERPEQEDPLDLDLALHAKEHATTFDAEWGPPKPPIDRTRTRTAHAHRKKEPRP